jgi:hypothetical protein
MVKFRNYFIVFASVFAITAACALVGMQDVKAQEGSMSDLIKRIEALEAKPGGSNVTAGKINRLKIGLNLRHRYELRSQEFAGNLGSGQTANGVRTYDASGLDAHSTRRPTMDFTLQRMRLSFDADINRNVMARVMFQDSRTFGEHEGNSFDSINTDDNLSRTDVQEGYVQLRNLGDITPLLTNVQLRIGRWQQDYGNQRQIGSLGWANQSRSYDGAKVMYKKGNLWVDVFAWQVHENATGGVSGSRAFDQTTDLDTVLYGMYSQYKFGGALKGNLIEPFVIVKAESTDEDRSSLTLHTENETRYSWGFRAAGSDIDGLGGFDYTVEPVWQTGTSRYTPLNLSTTRHAKENIDAWAIHAEAGYTFKNVPWTPRIGYAYSFASGDDNYNQGTQKTFKQISPTQHAHNGYMDVVGWQNVRDHQIHFSVKPTKKLAVDVKAHFFELDQESDDWYSVGGTVRRAGSDQFIDKNGTTQDTDDELGQEIDVTLKYKLFENFGVVAGYSHFFAGDFIEDTSAGVDRGSDWFYLQTTVSF